MIIINRGRVVAAGTSTELREEFLPSSRFNLVIEGNNTCRYMPCQSWNRCGHPRQYNNSRNRSELNLRVENEGDLGPAHPITQQSA